MCALANQGLMGHTPGGDKEACCRKPTSSVHDNAAHPTSFSLEWPTIVRVAEDSTPRLRVRCKLQKLEDALSQPCLAILIDYTCHVSSQAKRMNKTLKHVKEPMTAAISKAPRASGRGRFSKCSTRGIRTLQRLSVGLEECASATIVCAPLSEISIQNISTPDNAEHGLHSGYCWAEY